MNLLPSLATSVPAVVLSGLAALAYAVVAWVHPRASAMQSRALLTVAWLLHLGVLMLGLDGGAFWSQMQGGVDVWADVGNGVVKSVVFGFAVTFIALLQGYSAHPTPEGVSRATTRTVVMASLTVLALDFILTATMFSI